jgi:hypothetical protein
MKKWLPMVATISGAMAPLFSDSVKNFWSAHPAAVAVMAGVWATIKWLLPSPIQNQQ